VVRGASQAFQIWALTWLYAETIETKENHPHRLKTQVWSYRYPYLSAEEMIDELPNELVSHIKSPEDIINRLSKMKDQGYLENNDAYPDATSRFFLTAKGMLKVRKFWHPFVSLLELSLSGKLKLLESSPADKKPKLASPDKQSWFRQFTKEVAAKLRGRSQDEIVDTTITLAKQYGKTALANLITVLTTNQGS
jgi:hypothetical protein